MLREGSSGGEHVTEDHGVVGSKPTLPIFKNFYKVLFFFPDMVNKRGAMEMSMGTIVTIVLLMSVLVLGLVFVKNIFKSGDNVIKMTDSQLQQKVSSIFENPDLKVTIYPTTKNLEVTPNEKGQIAIGIKNVANRVSEAKWFSYAVYAENNTCGIPNPNQLKWLVLGASNSMQIPVGEFAYRRITVLVPEGTPNCIADFGVTIKRGSEVYGDDYFQIEVKS